MKRPLNIPDLANPLSSLGGYDNASGKFQLNRSLERKVKSRKDLSQPPAKPKEESTLTTISMSEDNAVNRYFGDFSIESKRHVWDLLKKHPLFGDEGSLRDNRIRNNTTEVLPNDPIRRITNGGYVIFEHPETNGTEPQRPK